MQVKTKPVNCRNCSKILCMADDTQEFRIKCKCPHCGVKQIVVSKKKHVIYVLTG